MNYFIEKHDMEIILDALEALHEKVKHSLDTGVVAYPGYPYTVEEIDLLFQSLDNSGGEQVMQQVTDTNRDMIIEEYARATLDGMDFDSLWEFALECLIEKKDLLTNDVLEEEIQDFHPEILEALY